MYIQLIKGSQGANAQAEVEGLAFGPYQNILVRDESEIRLSPPKKDADSHVLRIIDGAVYYGGIQFREWTISPEPVMPVSKFRPAHARPPIKRPSVNTLQKRFDRAITLLELAIEDRLSVLEIDEDWKRESILTSDIEDQIGHWKQIAMEVDELKRAE